MTNLTTRDRGIYAYKKSMLGQWYTGLVQAAEHGLLGRDVQLVEMSGIPGPRTAGMLINAGYGTGALYDALNQRGAALARQTIPFQFDDAPLVTMAGRAVRVEVAWTTDLAETIIRDMKLTELAEFNSARGSPDAMSRLLRMAGIGVSTGSSSRIARGCARAGPPLAPVNRPRVISPKWQPTIAMIAP